MPSVEDCGNDSDHVIIDGNEDCGNDSDHVIIDGNGDGFIDEGSFKVANYVQISVY